MIIGKFSLELIEPRIFKNDMASSAIKSYVFIGKHISLGLLNLKVASVLAKSNFLKTLNSTSRGSRWGSRWGSKWGSRWGPNGGPDGGPDGGSKWGVRIL